MLLPESTSSAAEGVSDAPSIAIHNPEEYEEERSRWKGKGKATAPRIDPGSVSNGLSDSEIPVDWTQYDPPEGLKDPAGCSTDIVIQIIQESIDRVKARIVEEAERRETEDEVKKLRQEERLRQENEDAKYAETLNSSLDEMLGEHGVSLDIPAEASLPERPAKSKKRKLMNLLRRLNNIGEKGESSATGATLHRRDVSWSSIEQSTQTAKRKIVSEVLKRTTTNSSGGASVRSTELECVSCLDDFSPKEMVKAPCHSYCKPCFLRLISTACQNEQQWPPKCCLNIIPTKTINANINDDLKQTYRNRAAEWNIPVSERIYCNHANCSVWIRPNQINRAQNTATCSAGHRSCIICRGPRHEGNECPQDRDMMRTDELAEVEGWKRCYGCHAYVEHREACQHMTCRCGAEFCYVCGARWRTCGCGMEELAAVKRRAEERRQARRDIEALEEADIQEALRLVAEFEREEALKAELLQRERERIAAERRAKKIEERIKHEGERRRLVGLKFQELREVFANLHDLQRIDVQRTHSEEQVSLEMTTAATLVEFQESWKEEHEKLKMTAKAKLAKKEEALKKEYVARVIAEHRIEEQYQAELKTYWSRSRKEDREERAEAAMKELRRKMDDGFKSWEKWRDNELATYSWDVKEELGIREERMEVEERRLVENTREQQDEFGRRKAAELRWVDVVVEERDRMLNDMEIDEIERGEDVDAWFEDDGFDDGSIEDIDIEIPREMIWRPPMLGIMPSLIWSKS
ncbi:uncharacterized protein GGS22DRAFT_183042 [Annulohypoxylon maeteangense]|uniref:uncharacterized protein n=1 Tax=Annulohypoxylon maeteangense TaxID=1927788 RepID=UPI0020077671|nr:uncharacterized protein GGS22DRAFT_183042 [Annulohypoxylon maeteangense]KAI0889699.1 hypothetical protein GGS22DRAFT_183042 [Annulohypoxylon maeteangense]